MDPRFAVNDPPRPVPPGAEAETPLVTLAWRAQHAEHRRAERETARLQEALAVVAEECHKLRRAAASGGDGDGRQAEDQHLLTVAERIEGALAGLDVEIIAPEGAAYTGELTELLDNVAQRPETGADGPRVAEVIAPAVVRRGAVLRRGKAVVAVPVVSEKLAQEPRTEG